MIPDDDAIINITATADAADLKRACDLLHLSTAGNPDRHKGRLQSFLGGPVSRRRRTWLLLALRAAVELELTPDAEMSDNTLDSDSYKGVDILLDYLDSLAGLPRLDTCLPFRLLSDCSFDDSGDHEVFSLPARYVFPSRSDIAAAVGDGTAVSDLQQRVGELDAR